jgi:S-adenosyl methyltransferase
MNDALTGPNVARVYDVLLGGSSGFAADRAAAGRLLEICPQLRAMARENRAFLARAVTWAARQGIRQFADLATGMPAHPSVGDAARAVIPGARIAYVDSDPFVTAHVRAVLVTDGSTAAVDADLVDPASVIADPAFRAVIDMAEPVCLLFGLVLSLMPARQAREVVAAYADRAAAGSYVAISCGRCDDEALWKQLREAYTAADAHNHAPTEVAGFLDGLEVVPPGLTAAQNWRGGWHDAPAASAGPASVLGCVARKPPSDGAG